MSTTESDRELLKALREQLRAVHTRLDELGEQLDDQSPEGREWYAEQARQANDLRHWLQAQGLSVAPNATLLERVRAKIEGLDVELAVANGAVEKLKSALEQARKRQAREVDRRLREHYMMATNNPGLRLSKPEGDWLLAYPELEASAPAASVDWPEARAFHAAVKGGLMHMSFRDAATHRLAVAFRDSAPPPASALTPTGASDPADLRAKVAALERELNGARALARELADLREAWSLANEFGRDDAFGGTVTLGGGVLARAARRLCEAMETQPQAQPPAADAGRTVDLWFGQSSDQMTGPHVSLEVARYDDPLAPRYVRVVLPVVETVERNGAAK